MEGGGEEMSALMGGGGELQVDGVWLIVPVAGEGGVEDKVGTGGDEVDGGKAVGKDLHCGALKVAEYGV